MQADILECEHSLCLHLERSGRKAEVIEDHRKAWLSDADFEYLKEHGLNAVRIPFGYWVVTGPTHGDPFVGPAMNHLDRVVAMAERHAFQVLLDLHANPGHEQGGPPAGRKNDNWKRCDWRQDEALEVLRIVAERYAGKECVTGLQVANEPSNDYSMSELCDWFERAIQVIRSAGMHAEQVAIVLPVYEFIRLEEFVILWGARGNFLRFENVIVDIHYYHVFWNGGFKKLDHGQHLNVVHRHGHILRSLPGAVVGEWSLSMERAIEASDDLHRQFADAQLDAYACASHGWFFWNYDDKEDLWNLCTCIERGWLRRDLGMSMQLADCSRAAPAPADPCLDCRARAPPPGRFPQCYGSEERRLLAEMQQPGAQSRLSSPEASCSEVPRGQKRPRSDNHVDS
jgi:glucan 1,3-beta-glucosidase